jgi:hypothetical protein
LWPFNPFFNGGSSGGNSAKEIDVDEKENAVDEKLYEFAEKRYNFEMQRAKDLDGKAGNIIGYVSIITALTLGLGTIEIIEKVTRVELFYLFFGGVLALVVSIISSLFVVKVRRFQIRPNYENLEFFFNQLQPDYLTLLRNNASDLIKAFKENFKVNESKAFRLLLSWIFLIIGIALLLLFTTIFTFETKIFPTEKNQLSVFPSFSTEAMIRLLAEKPTSVQPSLTLNYNSSIDPKTNQSWIEIKYQWLKDNLTAYVVGDTKDNIYKNVSLKAILDWSSLMKNVSNNPAAWNITAEFIDDDNLTIYETFPPDIVLLLRADRNSLECQKYLGRAAEFHEDQTAQYAKILTSCGNIQLTQDQVYNIVLHEFAHTLGLGHAYNSDGDLMCGGSGKNKTCKVEQDKILKPSILDTNSLIHMYGKDGFGEQNRVLINKPYYVNTSIR